MYELWTDEELTKLLRTLSEAFAKHLLEADHNGERLKYVSKYELRMVITEITKEMRRRGLLPRQAPARVLYVYQTGTP